MSSPRPSRNRRLLATVVLLTATALVVAAGVVWWIGRDGSSSPTSSPPASPRTSKSPAAQEPTGWGPTDAEKQKARSLAEALPLDELAGQLIIARSFSNESSLELVREKHFAGVMVTGQQILDVTTDDPLESVKAFNDQLQDAGKGRGFPVMVPIDQEGGLVARLADPLTPFPTFMSAGAAIAGHGTDGEAAVTAATRASGAELRAAGYNTVFAPDGDITIGPADPIIGSRSAGSDPDTVARAVVAAVDGYSEAGMISAVKHFPGHNVDEDSHKGLPVLRSDRDRLRSHDLKPFAAAVADAAPGIMTGHLDVPAIDKGVPASMSHKVITRGLRDNLGFDGLVISDSLGMGAVMSRYPGGDATVEAIKAGSDLALMPADNEQAYDAVLAALRSGEIPEKQARESAARTIAYLLHAQASPELPGEPGSHADASEALSASAATIVAHPCPVPKIAGVVPLGSPEAVTAFRTAAEEAGLPLGSGTSVVFLGPGSSGAAGDVAVSTDTPYALASSSAPTKIALYGRDVPAMRALVKVLQGTARAQGALPVDVGVPAPQRC
ncbi:glycoside hydrolase family 3 N-terminal domain-containing protein [Aeromicrobium chenweiae]|uniref:beta-N-acetylhexosaminidase n=1 Tax=Aeromicrobium chenweiae TaxID=2079793 RepID=A0A2S0WPR7_9ACTN|nr:glycoside hydrolase family 3 N-terminal domain-containing protein [Aeromicrobium chenweiae]AWB93339.1 beta-N-acetylhexosaminidase [Aeromicrobium chenweiae]TGN34329.1 beta-N-acetylhexosaminidase [Aeromicrobium chenweiae]